MVDSKNRTVMDIVRSMLQSKKVPKGFWAEAVAHAIYVLNECPTRSNGGKTIQELWVDRKPNISHFKVFECIAYTHVPDALRKKLDIKEERNKIIKQKNAFLSYGDEAKGYKLYI